MLEHRYLAQQDVEAIGQRCVFDRLSERKMTGILDQIHKCANWKLLTKGFFDLYSRLHFIHDKDKREMDLLVTRNEKP